MKAYAKVTLVLLVMFCVGNVSALHFARWDTSMGSFTAELYDDMVPITAYNFINLTNAGFYNGFIFHRVVSNFVIQDGCPNGTGTGGPGYTIQDEFHPDLNHNQAGILAMARTSAPNSAGSQYYFTLSPQPHLNGAYAVFGKVIEGLDVVLEIGTVPTNGSGLPNTPVVIESLRILDLIVGEETPSSAEVVLCEAGEEMMFIVEAYTTDSPIVYTWILDGVETPGDFIHEVSFTPGEHILQCRLSTQDWNHTITWQIEASSTSAVDHFTPAITSVQLAPNPFKGQTRILVSSPEKTPIVINIYDLKGRKIRSNTGLANIGDYSWIWDGKDDAGKVVKSGLYFIKTQTNREEKLLKAVLY